MRQLDPYGPIPAGLQDDIDEQEREIGKWTDQQMLKARGGKRHLAGTEFDHDQSDHGNWSEGPGSGTPKEGTSKELEKQAEAGGFSYRRITGAPADGFMVSPYKEAEYSEPVADFDADDVRRYRREHRDLLSQPDHFLGGWRDGDTIYLDISIRAPDLRTAAELARKHKQLAIYDIKTGRTIPTEEAA